MLQLIGIAGALLSFGSNIPYIVDTIKKKTKPHRVTWGIFFLLNIIFLGNQLAIGATNSLYLVIAFTVSSGSVFALSFKNGVGGTTKLDVVVLVGALGGVVLWQLLDEPLASVIANIAVAAIASVPTYRKSWLMPETETKIAYLLGAIAATMAAISVGEFNIPLLLLPVYSALYRGAIYLILIRNKLHQ